MSTPTISPTKLAELMQSLRLKKAEEGPTASSIIELDNTLGNSSGLIHGIDRYGKPITFNSAQSEAISLGVSGENLVLIGAAGTGKTSCMNGMINSLIQTGRIPFIMNADGHKYLKVGTHGIVAISYTRRAVANLRKAMPSDMKDNCITFHKLLEYQPVEYYITDPETGEEKKSQKFQPTRDSYNPLPSSIKTIIVDEASMVSTQLFQQLLDALTHEVQFIFLGDIQQLPPVFGSAVLGFKMLEYKCIELTEVYRQALGSPIIKYATQIKDGKGFMLGEKLVEEGERGKITFHPWKKKLTGENACLTFAKFITLALDHGSYNPLEDMILIPFNKSFGTDEINKHIANHLAKKAGRDVYEVISGFNKLYFSVGDHVLFDKEDATILSITHNAQYLGARAKPNSPSLDYWGYDSNSSQVREDEYSEADVDFMLEQMSNMTGESAERVKQVSHTITVVMDDSGVEYTISTSSEMNTLMLSYALTVHKSQGSEWNKVFFILHQSHATMLQRELLYTGITRAAKELYVICEPDTFMKGVASQKIKGNTLAEKAEYFKGRINDGSLT